MKRLLLIVALGAGLAGCAMHRAETEQGYYASGALAADPALRRQSDDLERSQLQSARNFATPRGLWW